MSFTLDLQEFAKKAGRNAERVHRGVSLKLFSAVILDTPVDTGRLRGAWVTTVREPSDEAPETLDTSGAQAIGQATSVVEGAPKGTDSFVLTNNMPYAARIEYEGWSHTKAPAGMVRKNVIRFRELIQRQLSNLR